MTQNQQIWALARNRLVANWQRNQQHARKYHSYFWVFRKR